MTCVIGGMMLPEGLRNITLVEGLVQGKRDVPCRAISPHPSITSISTGPSFPPGHSGAFHSFSWAENHARSSSLLPALVTT